MYKKYKVRLDSTIHEKDTIGHGELVIWYLKGGELYSLGEHRPLCFALLCFAMQSDTNQSPPKGHKKKPKNPTLRSGIDYI